MLCDGCEEVSLGEGLTYGDCVFCSEPCFEAWFAGPRAARTMEPVAAMARTRRETRTALRLVAVTVVAAGAVLVGGDAAQARFFAPAFEPPAIAAAATCHKRRVVRGERKRITVPCGRRRVTDPRALPYPA
jgi:hypothetical protein